MNDTKPVISVDATERFVPAHDARGGKLRSVQLKRAKFLK